MNSKDWSRHTTWTKDDQEDFFFHLEKARSHKRGDYLRVQASHLIETGSAKNIQAALALVEMIISEYPHPVSLENAYWQRAICLERLNRLEDAIASYKEAFKARRNMPNVRTDAPLYFGLLVVRHNRTDMYQEVLSIFKEFVTSAEIIFPKARYMFLAVTAIIANHYGQAEAARDCAEKALDEASKTFSGLKRHPDVGLVKTRDKALEKKLRRILYPNFLSRLIRDT